MVHQDLCRKKADRPARLRERCHCRGHKQKDGQDLGGEGQAERQAMLLVFSLSGQEKGIGKACRLDRLQ